MNTMARGPTIVFWRRWVWSIAVVLCLSLMGCAAFNPSEHVPQAAQAREQVVRLPFQTVDLDWVDEQRQRAVPARLYWPDSEANRLVPLIVFSHGIGGSRVGYGYLGQYWASQGYASLHVQHVGSDRSLWCCNPFTLLGRLQAAASDREAMARAVDVRRALDWLLASERGPQIDTRHMAIAGHSYGANTALLLAGARVAPGSEACDLCDARFSAAILISAPPFYGRDNLASILAGVAVPTLHITASEDVIRIPGYESALSDRLRVFESTGSPFKVLTVFEGGSHSVFTGRPLTGGVFLNPKIKEATRSLSLAFLRRVFDGDEASLDEWHEHHAGLMSSFVTR